MNGCRLVDVIGQGAAVRLVQRLTSRNRLPPILLLAGLPGCGRRTLAHAITAALLCQRPVAGDACGTCESCRLVAQGDHPDVLATAHETDLSSRKDEAERIREEFVLGAYNSPLLGERRVFVIHGIDHFHKSWSNALLKVLEEPPRGVWFLLTAASADGILPTIRSRAQIIRLASLDHSALCDVLVRQGMNEADAHALAIHGSGSHRGLRRLASAPLEPLRHLANDGLRSEWVLAIMAALPTRIDSQAEDQGTTLAMEQRATLRGWFAALAQELRRDLRDPERAEASAAALLRCQAAERDLQRNIGPRLVLEGFGLAALEAVLRR